jgi:hypothetical protein
MGHNSVGPGGWNFFLTYEYHILSQSILHSNYIPIPLYSFRARSPVGVYKRHSLFPPSLPHTHKNLEPYRFRDRKCRYHGCKWASCKGCFWLPGGLKIASNQIDKLHCPCSRKYNLSYSEMISESNFGTYFRELCLQQLLSFEYVECTKFHRLLILDFWKSNFSMKNSNFWSTLFLLNFWKSQFFRLLRPCRCTLWCFGSYADIGNWELHLHESHFNKQPHFYQYYLFVT